MVDFTTLPSLQRRPADAPGQYRQLYKHLHLVEHYPQSILLGLRKPCDVVTHTYALDPTAMARPMRRAPLLRAAAAAPVLAIQHERCTVIHGCLPVGMSLASAAPRVLPKLFRHVLLAAAAAAMDGNGAAISHMRSLRMNYFVLEGCSCVQSAAMFADGLRIGLLSLPEPVMTVYESGCKICVCVGDEWATKDFDAAFNQCFGVETKDDPKKSHMDEFAHLI